MVYDPDAEAAKLAELIHQDQALAAHVIRIANSSGLRPGTRLFCCNMPCPCWA